MAAFDTFAKEAGLDFVKKDTLSTDCGSDLTKQDSTPDFKSSSLLSFNTKSDLAWKNTIELNDETPQQEEVKVFSVTPVEEVGPIITEIPRPEIVVNQEDVKVTEEKILINSQPSAEEILNKAAREQIVSEDFWKNDEVFKKIESIQKEKQNAAEKKNDVFELPSMLQNLRSKSAAPATKPWLMKKKKTEPQLEVVPEPKVEAASEPVNNEAQPKEETSENKINDIPEKVAENVAEISA